MEIYITGNLDGFDHSRPFFREENQVKSYTDSSSEINQEPEASPEPAMTRKRKKYYTRFLELLLRKTESDKRTEIFGSDPLK